MKQAYNFQLIFLFVTTISILMIKKGNKKIQKYDKDREAYLRECSELSKLNYLQNFRLKFNLLPESLKITFLDQLDYDKKKEFLNLINGSLIPEKITMENLKENVKIFNAWAKIHKVQEINPYRKYFYEEDQSRIAK